MEKTIGQSFQDEVIVKGAIDNIISQLENYQKNITGVKEPQEELKLDYAQVLKKFGENRGGGLFYPYLGSGIGNGALVELADGSVKYDFITGIGVHYFGHCHFELIQANLRAAFSDTVMQGNLQQNIECLDLQNLILEAANQNKKVIDHVFFSTSGAMANENALKILFQNRAPANRILAFENCFMGRTIAIASVTDKAAYRAGVPNTLEVDYLPFYDENNPEQSTKKAVSLLEKYLKRYPNQYACMVFELVQGEGGFYPGDKKFFMSLMDVLKKNEIPIFIDEVQTFGRTYQPFAFQTFGLDDYVDVVTIGKMSQVCATLYKEKLKPKPGLISQTFTGSSSSIASGIVIIKHLLKNNFFGEKGKIQSFHTSFVKKFKQLEKVFPQDFKGPYGFGMMLAFTPFNGDLEKCKELIHKLYANGVISFIAGSHPKTRVRFLPPAGCLTENDIETVCGILEESLGELGAK